MNFSSRQLTGKALTWSVALLLLPLASAQATLQTEIDALIRGQNLRETRVAICVVDLKPQGAETIVSHNADEAMIPASNMKLVTSAVALWTMGPHFRFQTTLRLLPDTAGEGQGDLLVHGDGDPAFFDRELLALNNYEPEEVLQRWVAAVVKTGTKQIGRLIIDDRTFDDEFVHPSWPRDQLNRGYCAQVAGLNFHSNVFHVLPKPTHTGHVPIVSVRPDAPFVAKVNRAKTGTDDTFWISRVDGTNQLTFHGQVKNTRHEPFDVTMHDPPMVFARIFKGELEKVGIKVGEIVRPGKTDRFPEGKLLQRYITPLPVVLRRTNKESENMFAEALFKRAGRQFTGSAGSWDSGRAAARDFLRRVHGSGARDIRMDDGSGMSRENRVTARSMVTLLAFMENEKAFRRVYRTSLAIGGEDGTLARRYARPGERLTATVHGKSGYINQVTTLSGYLVYDLSGDGGEATESAAPAEPSPRERVLAFSILFNDYKPPVYHQNLKELQDLILRHIDERYAEKLERQQVAGAAE